MLRWLEQHKAAADPRQPRDAAVQTLIAHLVAGVSDVLLQVEERLNGYQQAFNELFLNRADYGPFFDFLSGAQTYFQAIGIGLARLDHLTEIWERGAKGPKPLGQQERIDLLRILVDHAPGTDGFY
jgi:hypothetical protein